MSYEEPPWDESGAILDPTPGQRQRYEALATGSEWADAAILQTDRVLAAVEAVMEQDRRKPWRTDPTWEDSYHQPWHQLAADRHFLFIAVNQLARAMRLLAPPAQLGIVLPRRLAELAPRVKLLRDCFEHWDEREREWVPRPTHHTGRAYREFSSIAPDVDPRDFIWSTGRENDMTMGDIVTLSEIRAAAEEARAFIDHVSVTFAWETWPEPVRS